MANVITPANLYDTADVITAPEDGDDLDAAVIETDLQVLADRARYAQVALQNHLVWDGAFAVRPGGTLTSFTLDVGGIYLAALLEGTVSSVETNVAATTITQTAIEGGGGTLGASARWWYVYAFEGAGVEYEISLTAPGAGRRTKLGSATRVYLGCFRTTAAGAPIPGRKANGRWVYRRSALASNETRVLNASTSTGPADLDLSALVPPHARVATLALACVGGDGGFSVSIACDGDTSDVALRQSAEASITSPVITGDVECSASQVVDYMTVRGGTTGGATAFVHGFYE